MSTTYISSMLADADIASIAELLADQARARIVLTLSDGRRLAAGALAHAAGVSPSGATAHLKKLVAGGVLAVERCGRRRDYHLADPRIVAVLEGMALLARPIEARTAQEAYAARTIRLARMCYDHLAGVLGVAISEALLKENSLTLENEEYTLTATGVERFAAIGINVENVARAARRTRRPLIRMCLDWSERRPHVAGALGAALATRLLELGWLERMPATRAVRVTNVGRRAIRREFDVRLA
jgi:DNA-binding transcriptional ArsR family regulator